MQRPLNQARLRPACRHPDAAFFFADRLLALDHTESKVYALSLHQAAAESDAQAWIDGSLARLQQQPPQDSAVAAVAPEGPAAAPGHRANRRGGKQDIAVAPRSAVPPPFALRRCREQYLEDVATCQEALHAGESYEICLTNCMHAEADAAEAWHFYEALRRVNPAPFSAWLHLGEVRPPLALLARSSAAHPASEPECASACATDTLAQTRAQTCLPVVRCPCMRTVGGRLSGGSGGASGLAWLGAVWRVRGGPDARPASACAPQLHRFGWSPDAEACVVADSIVQVALARGPGRPERSIGLQPLCIPLSKQAWEWLVRSEGTPARRAVAWCRGPRWCAARAPSGSCGSTAAARWRRGRSRARRGGGRATQSPTPPRPRSSPPARRIAPRTS